MKILILTIILLAAIVPSCAAGENSRGDGLFSDGSFFSEAISSAADKLNKVTSGEERIVDNNAKGIDRNTLEYDGDPLGRPMVKPTKDDFQNKRKMNSKPEKRDAVCQ